MTSWRAMISAVLLLVAAGPALAFADPVEDFLNLTLTRCVVGVSLGLPNATTGLVKLEQPPAADPLDGAKGDVWLAPDGRSLIALPDDEPVCRVLTPEINAARLEGVLQGWSQNPSAPLRFASRHVTEAGVTEVAFIGPDAQGLDQISLRFTYAAEPGLHPYQAVAAATRVRR